MSKEIQAGNNALLRGNALFSKGMYNVAAEYLELACKYYKDALEAGQTPEQQNVTAAQNNLSLAYNEFGSECLKNSKTQDAINAFLNMVALNNYSFEAHHNLGFAYKQAGQLAEAITSFKKANSLKANDFSTLYNLAECQKGNKEYPEAVETFKDSLRATEEVPNLLTIHCKIIESASLANNTALLNSSITEAFQYAKTTSSITEKDQMNFIMVHYGKLCLADSSSASANMNDIANLYAKVNGEHSTLFDALIKFIYHDYDIDHDIAKAEHELGRLVKNDKEDGVFKAVYEAAKLIAQQDTSPKGAALVTEIVLLDQSAKDAADVLGKMLEEVDI